MFQLPVYQQELNIYITKPLTLTLVSILKLMVMELLFTHKKLKILLTMQPLRPRLKGMAVLVVVNSGEEPQIFSMP